MDYQLVHGRKMKNKLVTVINKDMINDLRDIKDVEFLYPLKSFCVGYNLEFSIEEIDGYILVNRILEDKDLDILEKLLANSKAKGIVFDDLGVIEIVKDLSMIKILLLDHLATNYESINYYLEYVDSVIVSNDLTKEEINEILEKANKPLVVNVFGLKTLMYSRRLLLSNYANHHNINIERKMDATISPSKYFKIIENDYGTKFYAGKCFNGLELLNCSNVLFYWYDLIDLEYDKILSLIKNNKIDDVNSDILFLNKPTIYKVGDIND